MKVVEVAVAAEVAAEVAVDVTTEVAAEVTAEVALVRALSGQASKASLGNLQASGNVHFFWTWVTLIRFDITLVLITGESK